MDMEKVIKGLECHQIDKDHRINCSDCPYHCDEFMNGLNELHNDAIELLKEQGKEIQSLKDRIEWIDVHETMFELSPMLVMEREYCKKRLKELMTLKGGD